MLGRQASARRNQWEWDSYPINGLNAFLGTYGGPVWLRWPYRLPGSHHVNVYFLKRPGSAIVGLAH